MPPLVVGIGASAGGLEAFRSFFARMPADSGMVFVLVQHLAPHHNSLLTELIGRSTDMQVLEATDGEPVQPDHVYVIPPDATLTIADGVLHLSKPAPPRQHRWPIDTFFVSLAEDQGDCAVSIVLSGAGSDGAHGLRAIKEHGGLTLAQAGYDHVAMSGMPASANATGLVDEILQVEEMPARLLDYQQHMKEAHTRKDSEGIQNEVTGHLPEIMRLLHADSGHDFSQYKEKTLVRRVQRRMQVVQAVGAADYVQHLRQHPAELGNLFQELLISVTEFFRDPAAFEALAEKTLPVLLKDKTAADTLRVWVAGCATGQEAYSIAMLFKEAMGRGGGQPKVQVFATDIDERAINAARTGRYREPLQGLSPERLRRWFQQEGEEYVISRDIRDMCIFSTHSAIKDPPFTRLDLISCRNLMIYMNPELQGQLLRVFHYALQSRGHLLLGPSEGLSRNARLFTVVDKKHRLYMRRDDAARRLPELPALDAGAARRARNEILPRPVEDTVEQAARRVLARHSPAYVVIDRQHEVLRFSGDTGRYLQPAPGAASLNLFALLHKGLRGVVRTAVQEAFEQQHPVRHDHLSLAVDERKLALQLIVEPLPEADGRGQLCVVALREHTLARRDDGDDAGGKPAGNGRVQQLEQELDALRLQLHTAIDQQEVASEELKSANEEYQSVNEELQSSNEELETSKEEMQSINEELQVVNAELHSKNAALEHINNDLRNLMDSTQIATLFLDAELRIASFTPSIVDLFHIRESDLGRPINEISARVSYLDLEQDMRQVLRHLGMIERVVQGGKGDTAFLLRMRPYRTLDNKIDGVVITFTDITERQRLAVASGELAAIVTSSQDMIISHSPDCLITSWNASAEDRLGWSADEAVGKPLTLLLPPGSKDGPMLLQACERDEPQQFEMQWLCKDGARAHVAVTSSPVRDDSGRIIAGSLIGRDITERVRLQHAVALSEQRRRKLIEQAAIGIAEISLDGRFLQANPKFCNMVGRSFDALSRMRIEDIVHPEELEERQRIVQRLHEGEAEVHLSQRRYLLPDGDLLWVDKHLSMVNDENGAPESILVLAMDTTERRKAEAQRELMLGELNHRVKNTLASVQSIAMQTLNHASSLDAFRDAFLERLQALSKTHNLLAADAWEGVCLDQVVRAELSPWMQDGQPQATIECQPVKLAPKIALALAMALHELATNAAKYGALSVPEGRVSVRATASQRQGQPWLSLQWRESGGPPVAPPTRRGFGSRLIADGLAYELDGEASLQFDAEGVNCTLEVPLSEP